jgi:hypothetical protein
MSSLLREVVPLALAAAISPVIFLLQLNTLTGERPIARGAALTAGVVGDRPPDRPCAPRTSLPGHMSGVTVQEPECDVFTLLG